MTQTPEIYILVSHPTKDLPAELVEHQLSYGLVSGKSDHGYLLHEHGAADFPKEQWPEHCRLEVHPNC